MTPNSWYATVTADLGRLEPVLLDTVDIPDPDDADPRLVKPKRGDDVESAARRGNDTDADYARIPDPGVRTSEPSDPTLRQVTRWEQQIANVCTGLEHLVDAWVTFAAVTLKPFGRDVTDEHGRVAHAPCASMEDVNGRWVVVVPPSRAAEFVHVRCVWMAQAADAIVEWWSDPANADDQLPIRAHNVQQATRALYRHYEKHHDRAGPGRCLNPHGLHNHPLGRRHVGGVCARCREDGWCDTCGVRQPATYTTADGQERDRADCWSCIGKKKRERQNA